MKYIFLDFDGVLQSAIELMARRQDVEAFAPAFSYSAIMCLRVLIRASGAKIVISSNWRHFGLVKMKEMWHSRKLPGEIVGITPYLPNKNDIERGQEILSWLKENDAENSPYVILDDRGNDLYPEQRTHLVKVNYRWGLSFLNAWKAIRILNH